MRAMNKGLWVTAAVAVLAACSSPQAPSAQSSASDAPPFAQASGEGAAHDVAWYKTHDAERKAMRAKCSSDPGNLRNSPDCVNAESAAEDLTWNSKGGITAKDLKPVTFDRNKSLWDDMKTKPHDAKPQGKG